MMPADATRLRRGAVVLYSSPKPHDPGGHESVTRAEIARKLATLKAYDFAGDYDPAVDYPGPVYFVPSHTLVGSETALELGIRSEQDLFGGVVPYAFAATKTITHPLVAPDAQAPEGWSPGFGRRVHEAVLSGFAVFTPDDARRAFVRLREQGLVRVKQARGIGGRGQKVISDATDLEAMLEIIGAHEILVHGLVLEQELVEVTTYSVGQVRVAGLVATYYGTQQLTANNSGVTVYGGSDLIVVRGEYDALLELDLTPQARLAIAQGRAYDAAATEHFPGLIASRRNYDVAQGRDASGQSRSGVLEQSWRIGGASGAEVAALEAFRADGALHAVRASCTEIYGACEALPPRAIVYFRGIDHHVGPITKYVLVEPYANPR